MPNLRLALFALLLTLSPSASLAKEKAPKPAKPAMWVLKDKDTTIYMFGTIHALPKGTVWRTAKFDAAVAASQELIVEVAELDDTAKIQPLYFKLASAPALPPVLDRVRPEKRANVEKLAKLTKLDLATMQQFESWAVANVFTYELLKHVDIPTEYGVDRQIVAAFKERKLPVTGIETAAEQLGAFDTLSEKAQLFLLEGVTDDIDNARVEYDKLLSTWARGDANGLDANADTELKDQPELLDKLLIQRNLRWAERLEARMQKPGVVFFAVGSGHLVGKNSVQTMLKAKKFRTKRIQ